MNCQDWEPLLIEAARGAESGTVREHVRDCGRCAAVLANHRALSRGLAELADRSQVFPPDRIQAALLGEFSRRRRRTQVYAFTAGAIAASIIAIFLMLPRRHTIDVRPMPEPPTAATLPLVEQAFPPAPSPTTPPLRLRSARLGRQRAAAPQAQNPLIAIPFAPPLSQGDRLEVVRVSIPVMTLVSWGLAAPTRDPDLRVTADVLVGEDGLARAVRVVQ
jgi:hypothetical protein